jgi:hypothetical protein
MITAPPRVCARDVLATLLSSFSKRKAPDASMRGARNVWVGSSGIYAGG